MCKETRQACRRVRLKVARRFNLSKEASCRTHLNGLIANASKWRGRGGCSCFSSSSWVHATPFGCSSLKFKVEIDDVAVGRGCSQSLSGRIAAGSLGADIWPKVSLETASATSNSQQRRVALNCTNSPDLLAL